MERWRKAWRNGVAPCLSTAGLEALRAAVAADDPALLQGATTTPPPLMCVADWPVEAACPIAFAAWKGDGKATVAEVEEAFGQVCFKADERLKESAGHRWFVNWIDESPRGNAFADLLPEIDLELARRASAGGA